MMRFYRRSRYRLISVFVELSCASSGSVALSSSGMIRLASTLPSSTPHWSNELIFQMVPWTKTLCSYSAMSLPRFSGVRLSARWCLSDDCPQRCGVPLGKSGHHRRQLRSSLAERQRLRLSKEVRHEQIMMSAPEGSNGQNR